MQMFAGHLFEIRSTQLREKCVGCKKTGGEKTGSQERIGLKERNYSFTKMEIKIVKYSPC